MTRTIIIIAVSLTVAFAVGTAILINNVHEKETFTSPGNTNTIVVKYDSASRPTVYKKKLVGNEVIWEYDGTGFNEEVRFNVEWVSEDQFVISYDDSHGIHEEFDVTIP